jgi:hypothetical protein
LSKDLASGRNVQDLPADIVAAMYRAMREVPIDLDGALEGDVAL